MKNVERAQRLNLNDGETGAVIDTLKQGTFDNPYYLVVLSGRNNSKKKSFVNRLGDSVEEIDLRNIISTSEEESYQNIDSLFESVADSDKIICLKNGDVLSGEYTGHTYSHRRYATPQEKYLLRKISGSGRAFILDFTDNANVNSMIERHAQAIIECTEPTSGFARLLWTLKNIRLHGHTFENKRPIGRQIADI
jgi:hypothetical protein